MFRLLICDDHPPIRTVLRLLAKEAAGLCDVTETGTTQQLLTALQGRAHFDLLTLDLQLPGGSGLDALQQVRQLRPDLRVMVLSADDSPDSMQRAMALGANTYMPKSVSERELFEALRAAVRASPHHDSPPVPDHLPTLRRATDVEPAALTQLALSARQRDVLLCLLRAMSAKQIARELGISSGTVKTHTVAVFRALNVSSRAQAVVEAGRRGIAIGH